MRIISGKAKGTKLYTLEGINTRPTLDRVKESLFNIINDKIYDSNVLDLFSGSGAIGLEFASRGAKSVTVCDNSKSAIDIIKKNIEKTHLEDKIKVYNCDFMKLFQKIKEEKYDIIYLDPPYATNYIIEAINVIKSFNLKSEDGIIIAETDNPNKLEEKLDLLDIKIIDKRKYGRAHLFLIV